MSTPRTRAEARATTTPNRWVPSPKVRLWLYGILVALAPIAVAYGILSGEHAALWLTLAVAVLGNGNLLAASNPPR